MDYQRHLKATLVLLIRNMPFSKKEINVLENMQSLMHYDTFIGKYDVQII